MPGFHSREQSQQCTWCPANKILLKLVWPASKNYIFLGHRLTVHQMWPSSPLEDAWFSNWIRIIDSTPCFWTDAWKQSVQPVLFFEATSWWHWAISLNDWEWRWERLREELAGALCGRFRSWCHPFLFLIDFSG